MPNYQGQTSNPVTDYTQTLGDARDYQFSVQRAKDLHLASMPAQAEPEISLNVNEFGIPEDMSLSTPNITEESLQGEEDKASVLANIYNAAPEWMQRAATPFLVPFTDNPVMRGITIGTGDAINGTLSVLRDINNALHPDNQFSEEDWLQIPDIIERGDSTTEAIVGGLTQFMSVYGALGKFSNVSKMSSRGAKLFDDIWRAALADAAFDPEDGNLSTFITMLDEDETIAGLPVGNLNGPFTQWLGTPVGEDADAWERLEGRAKNLLEGAGLGMLANGVIASLKGLKQIMVETNPDKYFAMLKKAGFDVDPRQFLFENTLGAENIKTPQVNELGMYSQLEKAMINMTQDKNKPEDLLRYLRKNGVSNDELNNSGVMDLINEKKAAGESLTKDEVMEVFTDMDVTQSYQATTRTYERPSDLESMTDEDELLEIYRAGGELDGFDNVNGRVLEPDDDQLYDYRGDGSIEDDQKRILREFESGGYDGQDAIQLFEKLQTLYPDTYPRGMENDPDKLDEFYFKLGSMKGGNNYKPELHSNPEEFRQQIEEATQQMALDNYQANPTFQWELNEEHFRYQITGNESDGYRIEIHSQTEGGGQIDELDTVYSPTEAMVRVQGYEDVFGSGARPAGETKWHEHIVHEKAVDTYKETVITADSPSGTVFKGGMAHFPEDNKVFHLRTTEPDANTLFIEELQSDWANDISKKGVKKGQEYNQSTRKALQDAVAERDAFLETTDWEFSGHRLMGDEEELIPRNLDKSIGSDTAYQMGAKLWGETPDNIKQQIIAHNKIVDDFKDKVKAEDQAAPQSPLPNDKWINVGLRTAIAQAIDSGKTRVEWTPAKVHVDRWSGQYEKMYKILYDQKMGGIAKKIANKYNAKAGKHYIEISPEMIAHHKSGKGDKAMAAAPAIPAAQVANDKEDS